jgi:hypothetical protein
VAGGRTPGPICQAGSPVNIRDGTLCQTVSPTPGSLGREGGVLHVGSWDVERKLLEAARRAGPLLPAETRDQFEALFNPVNIGITSAVLAAWGASHLFGVGEAADLVLLGVGAFTIGWQAAGAVGDIADFVSIAARARTGLDLDRAATHLARAVVTIGIAAFIALILKVGGRLVGRARISARAATSGGGSITTAAGEGGPWWKAHSFGEDWPGTTVPRGFIMETGGRTFRVTVNATEHMAEYAGRMHSAGQLSRAGVWSTSPWSRFTQVDYPLSSLAGALEQAALKYGKLPPQRFPLEQFGNWELGIDTRSTPWVVEHALQRGR